MVIAIPSLVEQVKEWHAHPGKETVDEQAVGAASSITLRNGACLVQKQSKPTHRQHHDRGPPRCREHSHWAICPGASSTRRKSRSVERDRLRLAAIQHEVTSAEAAEKYARLRTCADRWCGGDRGVFRSVLISNDTPR
jgi:hypothetical protein